MVRLIKILVAIIKIAITVMKYVNIDTEEISNFAASLEAKAE